MSARPDFREESPTIFGFDYNALDGAVGASPGVPDSHSAPVVKHGGTIRTGNNPTHTDIGRLEVNYAPREPPVGDRPPGYPWQGHGNTIPGYPWQGHPNQAYSQPFLGPGGTSPLHRSGPNVGAYANAPGVPGAVSGSGYPQAVAGTYVPVPGQPSPFAGYAGFDPDADLGDAASRKARRAVRRTAPIVVQGRGFTYRLTYGTNGMDGDIVIVVSGEPNALPVGSVVSKGSARWSAIVAEVGTWAANKARRRQDTARAVAAGMVGVTRAATGGRRRRRRRRRRGGGQVVYDPPVDDLEEEETPGLPPWLLPVGLGVMAIVIVMASKKG
jgi:hypothetical protein